MVSGTDTERRLLLAAVDRARAERDQLRAENERLRAVCIAARDVDASRPCTEYGYFRESLEKLHAALDEVKT